jgi:hypothetical protein
MAFDSTVGGAASNSYVSRTEANLYFTDRLNTDTWDAASNDLKDNALVMATLRLDLEEYVGSRASETQNLSWPRYGVYVDGVYQDSAAIPRQVKEATYEMALALMKDVTYFEDTGLEGFKNVKLGELDVTPRSRSSGILPASVERLLTGLKTTSGYTTRLLKS